MPASRIKNYVNENSWNTYFKFCFERNPVDKMISHYQWGSQRKQYSSFEEYLNSKAYQLIKGDYFYRDAKGSLLVDKVYKMENLETAFVDICNKIGVNEQKLKPPSFKTKQSKSIDLNLNRKEIKKKYSSQLKHIFKSEYKDFYRES